MKPIELVLARRNAGVDQRELAIALGLSPQKLSDIERGYFPIPDGFEQRVHGALGSILEGRLAAVGRSVKA